MSSPEERHYINTELMPQIAELFERVAPEYQQPRDLGIKGEFASLYRKVRKLKSIFWDGADGGKWREDERTIILETIAHAFLMLCDYDKLYPELGSEEENPLAYATNSGVDITVTHLGVTGSPHLPHPGMTCPEYWKRFVERTGEEVSFGPEFEKALHGGIIVSEGTIKMLEDVEQITYAAVSDEEIIRTEPLRSRIPIIDTEPIDVSKIDVSKNHHGASGRFHMRHVGVSCADYAAAKSEEARLRAQAVDDDEGEDEDEEDEDY